MFIKQDLLNYFLRYLDLFIYLNFNSMLLRNMFFTQLNQARKHKFILDFMHLLFDLVFSQNHQTESFIFKNNQSDKKF